MISNTLKNSFKLSTILSAHISTITFFYNTPTFLRTSECFNFLNNIFAFGTLSHDVLYVSFILFFCYFYTAVIFNPTDIADNMKKFGGYIPGIRPGKTTAEYVDKVLSRITLGGALYISAICVLPHILYKRFDIPFYFGGTSLLIVVGVALDTIAQIETHLLSRHYDGFLGPKGARFRGRRR
jgi:preprotein translocase subunit SecY